MTGSLVNIYHSKVYIFLCLLMGKAVIKAKKQLTFITHNIIYVFNMYNKFIKVVNAKDYAIL